MNINLADVFYAVAIVWMVVNVIVLAIIAFVVIKLKWEIQRAFFILHTTIEKATLAKYSLQLGIAKKVLGFLKGGETS